MTKIQLILEKQLPGKIPGLDWNTSQQLILIAAETANGIYLELFHPGSNSITYSETIPSRGSLMHAALSDDSLVLLVFKTEAVIFSTRERRVIHSRVREEEFLSGGFFDAQTVWLTIPASSGSVDWSYWNFTTDHFMEYELQRHDHYGRGAVLHPSKKLIGACWSAYCCGFEVHLAEPKNKRLYYFDFDEQKCRRGEYEAYAPAFSPNGDLFAFAVNPYVGGRQNIEQLCVYSIFEPKKALLELDLEDTEVEWVNALFFLDDDTVLLKKNCAIDIAFLSDEHVERLFPGKTDHLVPSPSTGQFAIASGNRLIIYQGESSFSNPGDAEQTANDYILLHTPKLKIAGDEEIHIYAANSNLYEIPHVTVKFGYEEANYRLDTREVINEKLSPEVKAEVEKWFAQNQEKEMIVWAQHNAHKPRFSLPAGNGAVIEIFAGKRASDIIANFRVYYGHKDYMIRLDGEEKEMNALPAEIRGTVMSWLNTHRELAMADWANEKSKN